MALKGSPLQLHFNRPNNITTNFPHLHLSNLPRTSCTSRTSPITTSTPPKSKTPNPPSQRIPNSIHRPLWTPQTNLPLPARNIKQFDRRPCPETIAAAVVLGVLGEDETPQHGHVPAEGEGGPGEGLETDGWWGWVCGHISKVVWVW